MISRPLGFSYSLFGMKNIICFLSSLLKKELLLQRYVTKADTNSGAEAGSVAAAHAAADAHGASVRNAID